MNSFFQERPLSPIAFLMLLGRLDALTAIHRAINGFTLPEQSAPIVGFSWIDFFDFELALASVGLIWNGA